MSVYNFVPCATLTQQHDFVSWEDAFTDEELDKIVSYLDSLPKEEGYAQGDTQEKNFRKSIVSWVANKNEITSILYDRLAYVARKLNAQFYNFDLSGFVEDMQYTVYEGEQEGHYGWHQDLSASSPAPRKFTMVLQLSKPEEYEGGVLQTLTSPVEASVDKKRGMVVAFPSWTLHRVTPVTKGVRKTIVVWIAGPQFK